MGNALRVDPHNLPEMKGGTLGWISGSHTDTDGSLLKPPSLARSLLGCLGISAAVAEKEDVPQRESEMPHRELRSMHYSAVIGLTLIFFFFLFGHQPMIESKL